MALTINTENNVQTLIDKWIEQERNGVRFPVDFDATWQIAGFSRKDSAKRRLSKLLEGTDFHRFVEVRKRPQGGTVEVEIFTMSCDAFKHFCLLAETEQGREIRQYFIECEKKWKLVEQHHPQVAQETNIELQKMQMQTEILKLQNENLKTTLELRQLDSSMITMHGIELVLVLRGRSDQLVQIETVVTEIVNPVSKKTDRILTAEQLKKIVKQNTGQNIPSMKWFVDKLREKGRDDLITPVTRNQTSEYVSPETLSEAIEVVFGGFRQMLIGEDNE